MGTGRIVCDPAIMAGAPTIEGTRITVSAILGQLASGSTIDQLLSDYPTLTARDTLAALGFAASVMPVEKTLVAA